MSILSFRFIVKNETKRMHDDPYEQAMIVGFNVSANAAHVETYM